MSDDLNYGSGLPWWTSQSPTSGFQRTLLDLPSLLPKEKPLITTSRIQLLLARGLRRKKNLILQDLRSPKNAKEIAEQVQSVHTKSEVFVDISTVDLFTIRWQRCSTLCCETPITQINSYSQFDTRTFWGLAIFNWFHDNSCTGLSACTAHQSLIQRSGWWSPPSDQLCRKELLTIFWWSRRQKHILFVLQVELLFGMSAGFVHCQIHQEIF